MLANVQQTTIKPVIEGAVAKGALVHTDEYAIYVYRRAMMNVSTRNRGPFPTHVS